VLPEYNDAKAASLACWRDAKLERWESPEAKRAELLRIAEAVVVDNSDAKDARAIADAAVKAFVQIYLPETSGGPGWGRSESETPASALGRIDMVVANASDFGVTARSTKPGNIVLNWRKLIDLVPDVLTSGYAATVSPPLLLPFIGLQICSKVRKVSFVSLTDAEASVILALWKNRDGHDQIDESVGYEKTSALRDQLRLRPLTRDQYMAANDKLSKMNCIEIQSGVIWLKETVKTTYS
jgi:hypothetical protein